MSHILVRHLGLAQVHLFRWRQIFNIFCTSKNIIHELLAPYNPKVPNGLAESAFQNVKIILRKCALSGEDPEIVLYHWCNVPCKTDTALLSFFCTSSTHQLALYRQTKTIPLSSLRQPYPKIKLTLQLSNITIDKRFLPPIKVGQLVSVQDPHTNTAC